MVTRRFFLLGGIAACSLPAEQGGEASTGSAGNAAGQARTPRAPAGPVLSPEQFGARGDGRSDDSRALQACMDRATPGAVVRLRRGAVYRVDTNRNPSWARFGGLRMRPGVTLDLNGAELRALPSALPQGAVVQAARADGWSIVGPGRIVGERDVHRGRDGEWGMGIAAFSARGWTVGPAVEVSNCWGDGIYVGSDGRPGTFCEAFTIDGVGVSDCRRNGISVVAGRNGQIRDVRIRNVGGTSPEGGIDLEPDRVEHPNRNIAISGGSIRDVGVGVYVTVANENIWINGLDIAARNSGIIIGDNVTNLLIENNPRIASTIGGAEGAAVRTVVANPSSVRSVRLRNNGLFGGGFFVLEFDGRGYRDVAITGNHIHASNRGTQGAARLVGVTFTDNQVVIDPGAGRADDFFAHLSDVTRGRNVYRNRTAHRMHAVIFGGRDLGGERYVGPSLRAWIER